MDIKHMHVSTWHLHLQINLKQILKDNYFYFEEISLSLSNNNNNNNNNNT